MHSLNRLRGLPRVYETLRTARDKRGLRQGFREISADKDLVVQSGPFRGMRYPPQLTSADTLLSDTVVPKLLGSYEAEPDGALMRVFEREYRHIIHIGCAEGYYAVGLALRLPDTPVFAFDINSTNSASCIEMARMNGVAVCTVIRTVCTRPNVLELVLLYSVAPGQ